MFKFLDDQFKLTGTAFWACRACTQYAKQMNHKMREIETELNKVKESCQNNESSIQKVKEDVTRLAEVVATQSKKVEEAKEAAASAGTSSVFEELRERERAKRIISSCTGWVRPQQNTQAAPDGTGTSKAAKTSSTPYTYQ
jgi:chromosome segregation ATPase